MTRADEHPTIAVKLQAEIGRVMASHLRQANALIIELESGVPLHQTFENLARNYEMIGTYFQEIIERLERSADEMMARKAVGAVNSTLTSCSAMTRQNAPASGVPTGFPSYKIVVLPLNSGA